MKQLIVIIITSLLSLLVSAQPAHINTSGKTVRDRFTLPAGYTRLKMPDGSFGAYVQQLKLLPNGSPVHYYSGGVKANNNIYIAVVDMNIGNQNLQQCADVIIHVRADYLYKSNQRNKMRFTFTNGFVADYDHWQKGYRIAVSGNKAIWVKQTRSADNDDVLLQYMDMVYTYCGTRSLSKELSPVKYSDIRPGDVLIKGGSPGHAELVLDAAQDSHGNKIYLLAQGYMPAQQMQVLVNRNRPDITPWYQATGHPINTPEWTFNAEQVMRFKD